MKNSLKCTFGALIAAGGISKRFGKNKLLEKIAGIPVFVYSVRPFAEVCPDKIVLVVNSDNKMEFAKIAKEYLPDISIRFIDGGGTRAESVLNGLSAFAENEVDFVAIHDAARPLLDSTVLRDAFDFASRNGSAVFSSKITDTVKYLDSPDSGIISKTIDREHLWAARTPQIFRLTEIKRAYRLAGSKLSLFTDDSAVMEASGFKVRIFPSPPQNIKITHEHDISIAEAFLERT